MTRMTEAEGRQLIQDYERSGLEPTPFCTQQVHFSMNKNRARGTFVLEKGEEWKLISLPRINENSD